MREEPKGRKERERMCVLERESERKREEESERGVSERGGQ